VALPREFGWEKAFQGATSIHIVSLRRKSIRLRDEVRAALSLLRLYRRLRPTLVHHVGLKPTLYGGIAARIAGIPAVVSTLTGLGYLFVAPGSAMRVLRWIVMRGLSVGFRHKNHRVIFQHSHDRDYVCNGTNLLPSRSVITGGSGVNLAQFKPAPETSGIPLVLMASRLLWVKGVGDFVAAARAITNRGLAARFLLAGDTDRGHPSAISEQQIERWQRSRYVEWQRWQENMPELLQRCHVVCLPSYYGEGVPRILLEAAASGRAIVASDTPGCREIVIDGQNGILVPPRDVEALVDAIARLLSDARLRESMGTVGRALAERAFSDTRAHELTVATYRAILSSISESSQ
jgi:glycosyltransferase involved in cell wall biosynthesis